MKKWFAALAAGMSIVLAGCATNPIPEGYTGPRAYIRDTGSSETSSRAVMFWLNEVDGKQINTSPGETAAKNQGRGFSMSPVFIGRDVPAKPLTLKLIGSRIFAAPILGMTNPSYRVEGTVNFEPKDGKSYEVRGEVSEKYSAVWLVDVGTGEVVTVKIEKK
ncbi:MAG: hypothetical protein ACRCV9_14725 [Burkholderiaceae bacterium]